eukprot:COSAG02_NODE_113_length_35905_cov_25.229012_15_plen_89_part_00
MMLRDWSLTRVVHPSLLGRRLCIARVWVGVLILGAGLESATICARDARLFGQCSLCAADKRAVRQNEWMRVRLILNHAMIPAVFPTIK